jgi:tetratricopeptide (TPR) repeat protein
MKRIATMSLFLVLAGGVLLAGPDEDYLKIYDQIHKADALDQAHQFPAAATGYLQALQALQKLKAEHPSADAAAVGFRIEYLAAKLKEPDLLPFVSSTNVIPTAVTPSLPMAGPHQTNLFQEQIRQLNEQNAQLRMRLEQVNAQLKEAESVKPAAAAPGELEKARQMILDLEKQRDLLKITLDQLKVAPPPEPKPSASTDADKAAQTEIAGLKQKLVETERKLSDTAAELSNLKSLPPAQPPVAENLQQLTAERDLLKKQLSDVTKELADIEAHPTSGAATPSPDLAARLKQAEAERDDLKKEVTAMAVATGPGTEVERLRARVATLEAAPVPYTAEELALLKAAPSVPVPAPPVAVKEIPLAVTLAQLPKDTNGPSPATHSAKDLSAAAKILMQDGHLDVAAKRYDAAENKYLEVLREDPNNLYVLCNLASVQYDERHLDDCEKTVRHAIELDPNDPGSLYVFGVLRHAQGKLDDAIDALSRSALANSTNAGTQFYLGTVLADKGLRPQAETAFRKALALAPEYADAHFALAIVYASETPPMNALARAHYLKSVDLHHEKDDTLEKLVSSGN